MQQERQGFLRVICLGFIINIQHACVRGTICGRQGHVELEVNITYQVACPSYALGICVYAGSDVVPLIKSWLSSLGRSQCLHWGSTCRLYSHSAQEECSPHHQPVHSTLHYQQSTTTSQLFSKKKCLKNHGGFGKR